MSIMPLLWTHWHGHSAFDSGSFTLKFKLFKFKFMLKAAKLEGSLT